MSTVTAMMRSAIGVGKAEADPPHRPHIKYLPGTSFHLLPWSHRFRFGWVLGWNGPYWHNGAGIMGDDWENGDWLGGGTGYRHIGPVALCRWRRRGSLLSDFHFTRAMGCNCRHLTRRWIQGRGTIRHGVLCTTLQEDNTP